MAKNSFKIIASKYTELCKKADGNREFSEAENWLLDNFYIIEKCAKEIKKTVSGIKRGTVRKNVLLSYAKEYLNTYGDSVNEGGVCAYLQTVQDTEPLSCDELWLFPVFLKDAVIQKTARLCEGGLGDKDKMGKLIKSLVASDEIELSERFESLCVIDKIFAEKTDDFLLLSDETKEELRYAVSKTARKSGKSEAEIAEVAVSLASDGKNEREKQIGYYLTGGGKPRLMTAVGIYAKHNRAYVLYPFSIVAVTTMIIICLFAATGSAAVLVSILPALEIAVAFSNFVFSKAVSEEAKLP